MMYEIGQRTAIEIRTSPMAFGFDYACSKAIENALRDFGIDENGHSDKVKGYERSEHNIHVELKGYKAEGCHVGRWTHIYSFEAWIG